LADFGVFEDAATQILAGGLEHGAGEIVAVDVEAGNGLEKAPDGIGEGVDFRQSGRRWRIDESGTPAIGVDELDEVVFGLGFDAGPKHAGIGVSSLPADVVESRVGAVTLEHVGGGERVRVRDGAVILFGNLRGGDAEAKETGVDAAEGLFNRGVIEKILVDVGTELGAGVHQRTAGDGADFVDDGGSGASLQNGVADGTSGAEQEDFHDAEIMP